MIKNHNFFSTGNRVLHELFHLLVIRVYDSLFVVEILLLTNMTDELEPMDVQRRDVLYVNLIATEIINGNREGLKVKVLFGYTWGRLIHIFKQRSIALGFVGYAVIKSGLKVLRH